MLLLKIFIFWRLGLFLITYLGSLVFPLAANGGLSTPGPTQAFDFWLSWAQWDGGHFYNIAKYGYLREENLAFFPLYPYLVRFLASVFHWDLLFAGLVTANSAFLLFIIVFFKLVREYYSSQVAFIAIISFIVFPTAFFATAFYSESLFLVLLGLTFLFLKKRQILIAAIFASLAGLTRPIGFLAPISVFYSYLASINFNFHRLDRKFLHAAVSLFGPAIYIIYLFFKYNDPFKFLSVEMLWQREVSDPISVILGYLWNFAVFNNYSINQLLDFLTTIFFLSVLILGRYKIPSSLWIFSMLSILIPVSSGTLISMPRYVLSSIGAFIIMGKFLDDKPRLANFLWAAALFVQAFLAVLFVSGYWVA